MRFVVCGTQRLQLLQKPQALLRIRQRHRLVAATAGNQLRQLEALRLPLLLLNTVGEPGNRGALKQSLQRNLNVKALAQPRDHPRRQQRVPAQLEEIVLHPHSLDLQHFAPDLCQCLFNRRARGHVHSGVCSPFRRR